MSKTIDELNHSHKLSFFDAPKDISTLANEQGVKPFDFDVFMLKPTLFPKSECADDLIATIKGWRK